MDDREEIHFEGAVASTRTGAPRRAGARLSRRHALALALACSAGPTLAQQKGRPPLVAFVSWFAAGGGDLDELRAGLRDFGYTPPDDIVVEATFTNGDREATRRVILDAVARQADVLVVRATATAHLAKELAPGLPVVMLVSDPLATGLVPSLARPGGNLTGLSLLGPDLAPKRLAFIQAMKPGLQAVAFLGSSADPNAGTFAEQTVQAGRSMGIRVIVRMVAGPAAVSPDVFLDLAAEGAEAVIVQPIFAGHEERIVSLARLSRLPVVSNYRAFALAGGLLTYGPDDGASTRRAAYFVQRILRGAAPGSLPIEQPSRFVLAVNLGTARALGLTVPASLVTSADEVID